ncbi:hypothetical protein [Aliiroseovarius crassostreae]|uniref:hypothetical protein n=1 Tax=Aliiroseovarius crassostreae TaxID=154981 RepID=UPI002201EF08|nr:hypothetical protein [Aliiroseovarius crassostreae]UWQ08729.1 hypothetical protein K3X25_03845 [Aliiroseovarius crassostreae]
MALSEHALNAHFAAPALASPILDQMRQGAAWLADHMRDKKGLQALREGLDLLKPRLDL